MIASQGYVIGLARLEAPAGARSRRKATVKDTSNRPFRCVATKGTIPKITLNCYFQFIGGWGEGFSVLGRILCVIAHRYLRQCIILELDKFYSQNMHRLDLQIFYNFIK